MDRRNVRFWVDKWLPSLPLGHSSPSGVVFVTKDSLVASFLNPSSREWDINAFRSFLLVEDMDAILEMHIGDPRRNDQLVWPSTKTSMYSVKSGYHWAQSRHCSPRGQHPSSSNSSMDHVCKVVWKLKTPPKLHNFMWRTLHGALATMENLFKRKCSASPMCPICNCHEEFIEDLLL